MQASIFHASIFDEAAGQRVRQRGGIEDVNEALHEMGLEKSILDRGWKLVSKYKPYFEEVVFRNVLIALRSHWDWFIGHNGKFISYALESEGKELSKNKVRTLNRIGFQTIEKQTEILERICNIQLELAPQDMAEIQELSLVRNLGLHNRWEVDTYYLDRSAIAGWGKGHVRTFNPEELQRWHRALIRLVNEASLKVAVRFKDIENYDHLG